MIALHSAYADSWYKNSSVRTKEPAILNPDDVGLFFPRELQPICQHPLVLSSNCLNEEYIITQTFYKYMQEVCLTETDVINPICLDIAYGRSCVKLPDAMQIDALSIIIDEAYHSYAAKCLSLQVNKHTQISPLPLPQKNSLIAAIDKIKKYIPSHLTDDFQLISACISENNFTDEILEISRHEKNINPAFHKVMREHARDEGRHASYFTEVMRLYWQQINEEDKSILAPLITKFINYYFDNTLDIEFYSNLLRTCNFHEKEIKTIINDSVSFAATRNKLVRKKNILRFLEKSDVSSYIYI